MCEPLPPPPQHLQAGGGSPSPPAPGSHSPAIRWHQAYRRYVTFKMVRGPAVSRKTFSELFPRSLKRCYGVALGLQQVKPATNTRWVALETTPLPLKGLRLLREAGHGRLAGGPQLQRGWAGSGREAVPLLRKGSLRTRRWTAPRMGGVGWGPELECVCLSEGAPRSLLPPTQRPAGGDLRPAPHV